MEMPGLSVKAPSIKMPNVPVETPSVEMPDFLSGGTINGDAKFFGGGAINQKNNTIHETKAAHVHLALLLVLGSDPVG